jgi:hypothetical protein
MQLESAFDDWLDVLLNGTLETGEMLNKISGVDCGKG